MTTVFEGQRFWKHGNHRHVWVVDAVLPKAEGSGHYALLVAEDGHASEEVDLDQLLDRNLYTRVPEDPHRVAPDRDSEENQDSEEG